MSTDTATLVGRIHALLGFTNETPRIPNLARQLLTEAADRLEALSAPPSEGETFQNRVQPWMMACFGAEIAADKLERADRFIEEALELCQTAPGFSIERAHALVDYVFNRPQGDINQEVGGVMVTLAAFCLAFNLDMHAAGETELARVWTKVEQIRAKQAAKPKGSALPVAIAALPRRDEGERMREALIHLNAAIDNLWNHPDLRHVRAEIPESIKLNISKGQLMSRAALTPEPR